MSKPDVIVAWPSNCDYPLWREYVRNNRLLFNNIIIVFTETNHPLDFRHFVRNAMKKDYVMFIDNPPLKAGDDWRNVAVNQALIHSYNAEFVWFTEQDLMVNQKFWVDYVHYTEVQKLMAIAVYQEKRLHPCSLFLHRELLESLEKDFSAKPPQYDHFGKIQIQLTQLEIPVGVMPNDTYVHLNGLSHNWRLMVEGQKPNYEPIKFNEWLSLSIKSQVPLDETWLKLAKQYLDSVKND